MLARLLAAFAIPFALMATPLAAQTGDAAAPLADARAMIAAESSAPPSPVPFSVIDYVRNYVTERGGEGSQSMIAVIPGSDLFAAMLIGPAWCGSGGCSMLVVRPEEQSYALVGDISLVRDPVRVLDSQSNGLPDLSVYVGGGGIAEGYEALLAFDGQTYPANPTVDPARRIDNATGIDIFGLGTTTISLFD